MILSFIFFVCASVLVSSTRLLLIGDLSAHNFVQEWCDDRSISGPVHVFSKPRSKLSVSHWGYNITRNDTDGATYCYDPVENNLVAQVHIYGSSDSGPYYRLPLKVISKSPRVIKTADRIATSLIEFVEAFHSYPDRIIFSSGLEEYFYTVEKVLFNKIFDSSQPQWTEVLEKLRIDFKTSFNEEHLKWEDIMNGFEKNMNTRIDQLQKLTAGLNIDIGVQTVPVTALGSHCIESFNKILRSVAFHRNITLYDYDSDIWSKVHYKYNMQGKLFRDDFFAFPQYSPNAVDTLLGAQHSAYYYPQGYKPLTALKSLVGVENCTFRLIRAHGNPANEDALPGSGEIFYSNFVDGVRVKYHIGNVSALFGSKIVTEGALRAEEHLHEKESEIRSKNGAFFNSPEYENYVKSSLEGMTIATNELMLLPEHVIDAIPFASFGQAVYPILYASDKNIGFTSSNVLDPTVTDMFISYSLTGKYKQIPYADLFKVDKVEPSDIYNDINRCWIEPYRQDATGINVYKDDTLLRYFNSRSVFVIKNGMKYGFRSSATFFAMGYDFDNVIVVGPDQKEYFDMIPIGGQLG